MERGGTRTLYAHVVAESYRSAYEAVFGPLPRLDGLPRHAGPVADTAWGSAWARIPAARQGEAIDTSTSHLGFRCVIRPEAHPAF